MGLKWILLLLLSIVSNAPVCAQDNPSSDTLAARASNLLSYIAVDYGDAVEGGQRLDTPLYELQKQQVEEVLHLVTQLPDRPGRKGLQNSLLALSKLIDDKASATEVRRRANAIADRLAVLYQLQRSPGYSLPSPGFMMPVYQQRCAGCHGGAGEGGTAGPDLNNPERMAGFSLYDLYNTLDPVTDSIHSADIDGDLTGLQRWALAVTVASFPVANQLPPSSDLASKYPGLLGLPGMATTKPSELEAPLQQALMWWRGNPHLVRTLVPPLVRAVGLLQLAETDYRGGDTTGAYSKLMLAYREGYRPLRQQLLIRDRELVEQLQIQWQQLRGDLIGGASSTEVIAGLQNLRENLNLAHSKLEPPVVRERRYVWAAVLFALAIGLGALLWWGLRRRKRTKL
ncbi:hypothetical protein BTJ40_00340 [Microbulbifer sp. A4B17]|uniref:hypothetical protein n=1 Tax=Microbulbifer sp. A4B17 TaxID=359370 RepID=UPI000D52CA6E|nr:hypothetical protein [Microbulbifer sp. A4B17]AWF79399.1 hypothetical protein BTJ40_00340 [Microbulbifer sp. A4B17]